MELTITSATKTIFSQWELSVRINDKAYKYHLSDYSYQKAMGLYNKGLHGKALAVLNKFNNVGGNDENIK